LFLLVAGLACDGLERTVGEDDPVVVRLEPYAGVVVQG